MRAFTPAASDRARFLAFNAIYHHALREVAALPDEAMFIDDVHENVLAAASLGINAFHFTSADELLVEFSRLGLWRI